MLVAVVIVCRRRDGRAVDRRMTLGAQRALVAAMALRWRARACSPTRGDFGSNAASDNLMTNAQNIATAVASGGTTEHGGRNQFAARSLSIMPTHDQPAGPFACKEPICRHFRPHLGKQADRIGGVDTAGYNPSVRMPGCDDPGGAHLRETVAAADVINPPNAIFVTTTGAVAPATGAGGRLPGPPLQTPNDFNPLARLQHTTGADTRVWQYYPASSLLRPKRFQSVPPC
jgi:hypothetical protein